MDMPARHRDPMFENMENLQEELVFEALPELIKQEQDRGRTFCACPTCMVDIAAVALNSLPPRYVADRYNIFGVSESERARRREEVQKAILLAIHQVIARPHHV
jgi:competence protein ComFB